MIAPEDRVFDRVKFHDPRSRNFAFSAVRETVTPVAKYWYPGSVLDQGREGACVAFADSGELSASPVRVTGVTNTFALNLYHDIQAYDRSIGNNFDSGASTLAGQAVLKNKGYTTEYRWAFTLEEIRDALITEGPVVIGIEWRDGMYYTDPNGRVRVDGNVVGGHEILLTGYSPKRKLAGEIAYHEYYRWRNSWGTSYGLNGTGFIRAEDLQSLMDAGGEAVVPMGRKLVTL